jgi:hypothetical protein
MITEYFSALLPLVLTASLQTTAPVIPSATPQPQSCPVTFQDLRHFTNQASQPISAVILHLVRVNLVGEEVGPSPDEMKLLAAFNASPDSQAEQTYAAKKAGLLPGQKANVGELRMSIYGRREKSVIRIYARAVKFADGTVWKDDGSHSCKWED